MHAAWRKDTARLLTRADKLPYWARNRPRGLTERWPKSMANKGFEKRQQKRIECRNRSLSRGDCSRKRLGTTVKTHRRDAEARRLFRQATSSCDFWTLLCFRPEC